MRRKLHIDHSQWWKMEGPCDWQTDLGLIYREVNVRLNDTNDESCTAVMGGAYQYASQLMAASSLLACMQGTSDPGKANRS